MGPGWRKAAQTGNIRRQCLLLLKQSFVEVVVCAEDVRECKSSVENHVGVDIPACVPYRTAVMNQRALTSDRPSAADPHVGATGGLYVVALFYLGYAYVYSYLLTAGGL